VDKSKHMVIIASAGRTGTRFFGDLLSSMIPGSYSVDAPDRTVIGGAGLNGLSQQEIITALPIQSGHQPHRFRRSP